MRTPLDNGSRGVECAPVFLLLSYFNLSLSGWTSGVAVGILEGHARIPD